MLCEGIKNIKGILMGSIVLATVLFTSAVSAATGDYISTIGSTYATNGINQSGNPMLGLSYSTIVDASGSVFVADYQNKKINKYDSSGDLVWSTSTFPTSTGAPSSVAIDGSGSIYASMVGSNNIFKLNANGSIVGVVIGSAGGASGMNTLNGTSAMLNFPRSIEIDGTTLYVADYNNNRVVAYNTITYNFLSAGSYSSPTILRSNGTLLFIASEVNYQGGRIYVANKTNITSSITSFGAGYCGSQTYGGSSSAMLCGITGIATYTVGGMEYTAVSMYNPMGIGIGVYGNIGNNFNYVNATAEAGNYTSIAAYGKTNTPFLIALQNSSLYLQFRAVNGAFYSNPIISAYGNNNLGGTSSQMKYLGGNIVDTSGNIYLQDWGNSKLRKFSSDGSFVAFLTTDTYDGYMDINPDTGELYQTSGNKVYRVNTNLSSRTVVLGNGVNADNNLGGTNASFKSTIGIAVRFGKIYVADSSSCRVKIYNATTYSYINAIGSGTCANNNSNGALANLNYPRGVAVDSLGNIYVSSTSSYVVKVYDSNLNYLREVGAVGITTDTSTTFKSPQEIRIDRNENLLVTDYNSCKIKRFTFGASVGVSPANLTIGGGCSDTNTTFNYSYSVSSDIIGNIYVSDRNGYKLKKYSGGYTASCASTNLTNISITTGTPTYLNQALVKDALSCGFTCINGYTGNSCEIAPAPSCATPPVIVNATFTLNPVSYEQSWVKDSASCGFACSNGYTGDSCEIAPFCTAQPDIPNAVFGNTTAETANQNWVKDAPSCGYTCASGFTGELCNESTTVEQISMKLGYFQNKGFKINVNGTKTANANLTGTGYVDISVSGGNVSIGTPAPVAVETQEQEKIDKVLTLVESNKVSIANKKSGLSMFEDKNTKTTIVTMKENTYNKYQFVIEFLETQTQENAVILGSDRYTKFIDTENGIIIFYKVAK